MSNAAIFGACVVRTTPLELAKQKLRQDIKNALAHLDKVSDGIDRVNALSEKVEASVARAAAHLPQKQPLAWDRL